MKARPPIYSACSRCTAKWFSTRPLRRCPRCGSTEVMHDTCSPPWNPKADEKLDRTTENSDWQVYTQMEVSGGLT